MKAVILLSKAVISLLLHPLLFSSLIIHPLYRPLLVSPPPFILSPMLHSLLFSSLIIHPLYRPLLVSPLFFILSPMRKVNQFEYSCYCHTCHTHILRSHFLLYIFTPYFYTCHTFSDFIFPFKYNTQLIIISSDVYMPSPISLFLNLYPHCFLLFLLIALTFETCMADPQGRSILPRHILEVRQQSQDQHAALVLLCSYYRHHQDSYLHSPPLWS